MTLDAQTDKGEALRVVGFDGNTATVHCPVPYAPGQPMHFTIALAPPSNVHGRTIGTKRLGEGPYEVRLRLVGLTRVDRERWLEAMTDSRRP